MLPPTSPHEQSLKQLRSHWQGSLKQQDSVADMVLVGHKDIAEFAEGISDAAPLVASGGRDTNVSCL